MSGAQNIEVHVGPYIDYGRGFMDKWQWLWTTSRAGIWTNMLGILVPLASARLLKILWRMDILAADYAATRAPPQPGQNAPRHILFTLDEADKDPTLEGLGSEMILTVWSRIRPSPNRLPGAQQLHNVQGRNLAYLSLGGVVLLSTYFGVFVFGILTSRLATDTTAASASPRCGLYMPQAKGENETFSSTVPYEFDAQTDSATLAQKCYHADSGADGCNYFLQQSMNYTPERHIECPFADDICYGDIPIAIRFTSFPISSRTLGINSPKDYEFQRTTTCSPLNMNETFVQYHTIGDQDLFTYQYGPSLGIEKNNGSWLTESYGSDFGKPPSYLVGTLISRADLHAWDPIPALRPAPGSSVTIFFILPQKIYYLNQSNDPIFPANREVTLPGFNVSFWKYTLGHARVMACLDQTKWRDPAQGEAWHNITEVPKPPQNSKVRGALWLFWFSILNSNTYSAISQRLGYALDASDRISIFTSLPLADAQWEVEATRLFETSLARTQIDARNIARGLMANYDGFVKSKNSPPEMCDQTYLFTSVGWTNINGTWSLLLLIPCALIVLLSLPTPSDEILLEKVLWRLAVPVSVWTIYVIIESWPFVRRVCAGVVRTLWKGFKEVVQGLRIGVVRGTETGRKVGRWVASLF